MSDHLIDGHGRHGIYDAMSDRDPMLAPLRKEHMLEALRTQIEVGSEQLARYGCPPPHHEVMLWAYQEIIRLRHAVEAARALAINRTKP